MTASGTSDPFGVIIPARFASTRLPGKPLLDLAGKPMIIRVLETAAAAGASFTLVATDDQRIADVVTLAGGEALLTSSDHSTGTDRIAEVARRKRFDPELVVVNLQGDEPGVPADFVRLVASSLIETPQASLATLATPIRTREELFDPNVVKVSTDRGGRALYFSRAPIPWQRGAFGTSEAADSSSQLPDGPFLRHVGLYAYRVSTLLTLSQTKPVALETLESLEQLRALWLGMQIQVSVVPELPAGGVDTEEDARRVRQLYER